MWNPANLNPYRNPGTFKNGRTWFQVSAQTTPKLYWKNPKLFKVLGNKKKLPLIGPWCFWLESSSWVFSSTAKRVLERRFNFEPPELGKWTVLSPEKGGFKKQWKVKLDFEKEKLSIKDSECQASSAFCFRSLRKAQRSQASTFAGCVLGHFTWSFDLRKKWKWKNDFTFQRVGISYVYLHHSKYWKWFHDVFKAFITLRPTHLIEMLKGFFACSLPKHRAA